MFFSSCDASDDLSCGFIISSCIIFVLYPVSFSKFFTFCHFLSFCFFLLHLFVFYCTMVLYMIFFYLILYLSSHVVLLFWIVIFYSFLLSSLTSMFILHLCTVSNYTISYLIMQYCTLSHCFFFFLTRINAFQKYVCVTAVHLINVAAVKLCISTILFVIKMFIFAANPPRH